MVTGRVVNKSTSEPIPRALVTIGQPGKPLFLKPVLTDEHGSFQFEKLKPNQYLIVADEPGYERDQDVEVSRVTVIAGPQSANITLRLLAEGAIEGTVRNDRGQPMESVVVQLIEARYQFELKDVKSPITADTTASKTFPLGITTFV